MSTNATGFSPNVARSIAQTNKTNPNQNSNNTQAASQGPRAATFSNATAPTAAPSTAVTTSGSAPAAPIGGTTTAAPARTAPAQAQNIPIAMHPGAMAALMSKSGVATQAVGEVSSKKDQNKDDTNKAINRATDIGDKSGLALQGDNSSVGEEAAKSGATGGASGPGAAAA